MDLHLYPLIFEPILKDRIWGGKKLETELGKNIPGPSTGESWELSAVEGDVSIIREGVYKSIPLNLLLGHFPEEILGAGVYARFGTQFPLLFKFLDAKEDLSIQVHPNDELAKKRHNTFGKTEMWYVMQADKKSRIIVGFKEKSNREQYLEHLKNNDLPALLNEAEVKKGDVFFLETGTIHAIGAGILIAEIQQTSDITYRVYDWDRTDATGKHRELHTEQALDAINYNPADAKKSYNKKTNSSNIMVDCPYFTAACVPLSGNMDIRKSGSSFTVYICTEGEYTLEATDGYYDFKKGDTILVPAALKDFKLSGEATLLEIYIS